MPSLLIIWKLANTVGAAMVGMELNREMVSIFLVIKSFSILTPDYMWPDAGLGTAQSYGCRRKVTHSFLSSES